MRFPSLWCCTVPMALKALQILVQVLCASNKEHDRVDPLVPPPGASLGARISFSGWVFQMLDPGALVDQVLVFVCHADSPGCSGTQKSLWRR